MNGTWKPVIAMGAMVLSLVWSVALDLSHADRAPKPLPLAERAVETGPVQQ